MKIDIWQDNFSTDNYKLFFESDNQSKKPDKIVLSGRDDDKNSPVNKWEFEIVDKNYIDSKNSEQDSRLTVIESHNEQQDTRLEDIEQHNSEQDRRLDSIDVLNSEQDNRLTTIESHNEQQDTRLEDIEQHNSEQDRRLDSIDVLNSGQDNRLTAIESHDERQDTRLDDIEGHNSEQDRRLDSIDVLNSGQDNRLTAIESHNERQDINISNLNLLIENSNEEIEKLKARKNVFERDIDIPTDIVNKINILNDGTYRIDGELSFYNKNNIGVTYSIGGILLKTEDTVAIDCFHADFGGLNEFESIRVSCYTQKGLVNNLEGLVSFLTSFETIEEFHHASLTNLNFSKLVTAPKKNYTKNTGVSLNFTENIIRNVQLTPYICLSDDMSDFYLIVDSTFDIIDIGGGTELINFINGVELPNGLSISDYFCGSLGSQFVRGDSPGEFGFGVFLGDLNNSIFDVRMNPTPPSSNNNRLQLTAHFIRKGE